MLPQQSPTRGQGSLERSAPTGSPAPVPPSPQGVFAERILAQTSSDLSQLVSTSFLSTSLASTSAETRESKSWELDKEAEEVEPLAVIEDEVEIVTDIEEVESVSEAEESEDEMLGFYDSGEERFVRAGMLTGRREAMVEAVHKDISDVNEILQFLHTKANMRLNELRQVITKQEKSLNRLKSALKEAVSTELNKILSAGWLRRKEVIELVDLRKILDPFSINRDYFPFAKFQAASQLLKTLGLAESGDPLRLPIIPHFRNPISDCLCTSPCAAVAKTKADSTSTEEKEGENGTSQKFSPAFLQMIQQVRATLPDKEYDRKTINAFIAITEGKGERDLTDQLTALRDKEQSSLEQRPSPSTSSVSSEDLARLDRTIEKMSSRQCCGVPTARYQKIVRRKLLNYYRQEKKLRRRCRSILPGGLSSVCLTQPPAPKYPPEGLVDQGSDISSEGILSDILSELEDETREEDMALLFESDLDADVLSDYESLRRTSRKLRADIFTSTFQVGMPQRKPNVLVEMQRSEMLPAIEEGAKAAKQLEQEEMPVETGEPAGTPRWTSSPEFCEKLDPCGVCVERMAKLPEALRKVSERPAEITEFWQLMHISKDQPIWIFRGRTVKLLSEQRQSSC